MERCLYVPSRFPCTQREGCVAQPVHWCFTFLNRAAESWPLRLPGSLWCGPVPSSSWPTGEAHSAEPIDGWAPASLPPRVSLPLKGNGAHWDQPARVPGGGLGLCCYSKCREPELGAATQLCPRVKQEGGIHSEGLLLGTGGWHNSLYAAQL